MVQKHYDEKLLIISVGRDVDFIGELSRSRFVDKVHQESLTNLDHTSEQKIIGYSLFDFSERTVMGIK